MLPRLRIAAPLLLGARLLVAQDAGLPGFDPETGLWFPPGAARDVYLSGSDPQHVYIQDVRKAFEADEALRAAACAEMNLPRNQVTVRQSGPRVGQLRTMVDMLCLAVPFKRKADEDMARKDAEDRRTWRRALDLEGARALPKDERDRRADALCVACTPDPDRKMANALAALGLKPYDDAVVAAVLDAHPFRDALPWPRYLAFLRELFAEQTRQGAPEAASWQLGLRSFHYFLGEFREARDLTRAALASPPHHNENAVFLALLERVLGNREAFPALLAACPLPEPEEAGEETEPFDCWDFARSLAARGVRQLKDKAPPALLEVLAESIAAQPTEWDGRLVAIRAMGVAAPARARAEAEALLRIPATIAPQETRLEAIAELGWLARGEKDWRGAIAAYDRYLDLVEFHPPPVPAGVWALLAALPERAPDETVLRGRAEWALSAKVSVAIDAGDLPLARKLLETYAAVAAAHAQEKDEGAASLAAGSVRYYLTDVARAELKAGRRAEAARIAGFLQTQPREAVPAGAVTAFSSLKSELARAGAGELKAEESPWDASSSGSPRRRPRAPSGRP